MLAAAFLLAGLVQTAPAFGTPTPNGETAKALKRTAFVVGNNNYRHVQKLLNPINDAKAVAEKLDRIGFDVTMVLDADERTLRKALAEYRKSSAGSDIALFYFAGHGVQISGENYFLPVSINASSNDAVRNQSLALNEVRQQLRRASAGLTIFMLDACRDNPWPTNNPSWTTKAPVILKPGLARVESAAGMLIAYATQPGTRALDGDGKNSPFTAALLRHIEQPGLEIRLMLGRVREDTVAQTKGAQVPWVEEAVLGEFYFSERTDADQAPLDKNKADDITFWRSIWRSTSPEDYEAYLKRFPKGTFTVLAANRLKALKASKQVAAAPAEEPDLLNDDQRRLVQNSLYWLGYYNGKLTGVRSASLVGAVQAFQLSSLDKPTGRLNATQINRLHDSAATSLIALGERLSDRIVFDRVRLRSIDRGIEEIALPAFEQLKKKLPDDAKGRKILAEAKQQLDAMHRQRNAVRDHFERATNDYVIVVTAAGASYATQMQLARYGRVRAGDSTTTRVDALAPRREIFLKHALTYAKEGKIDEKQWLADLR